MRVNAGIRTLAVVLALGPSLPVATDAQTLTFADVPLPPNGGPVALGLSYTTQGYRFECQTVNPASPTCAVTSSLSVVGPANAVTGRSDPALFNNHTFGVTRLTRADGSAFDLLSWRLGPLFNDRPLPALVVEGTLAAGGTVTQSFVVPLGGTGFTLFNFGSAFRGLASVRWRAGGFAPVAATNTVQFAAISVAPSDVAIVPEPATLVLVGAGCTVMAVCTARRRTAT